MKKLSKIAHKYPTYRDSFFKGCNTWIEGKRLDDNAEGLWRVHDKLYDLTEFIDRHPGGAQWLEMTKGVDITEQFETHHISSHAENMLEKFYVCDASLPRNYKITFHPDGFYKTLKRRVASKLAGQVDKTLVSTSRFYCDLVLASTILSFILASRDFNFVTVLIASLCLVMLTVISHNFLHQSDNWRMYLMNFNLQSFRDWRGKCGLDNNEILVEDDESRKYVAIDDFY